MSKIEWTDDVWNPIVGCSKVSEGCENCYAERMAYRLACMGMDGYTNVVKEGGGWNGYTAFIESALQKPIKRKKPTVYFVGSMGDIFHNATPARRIMKVFEVIKQCPQHTFLILTKRPEQAIMFGPGESCNSQPLPNVYIGVTAENQQRAEKRIPNLLRIPAAGRFVSCEPLLGELDIFEYLRREYGQDHQFSDRYGHQGRIHQVIVGGESGPDARPMHPDWVREVREDCAAAAVPFFFKQWGKWLHIDQIDDCEDEDTRRWMSDEAPFQPNGIKNGYCAIGKKRAGRTLDGRTHDELIWRA